jgi:hypothetical protein
LPVYITPYATKDVEEEVPRSFRERWFTRPWRPLVKTKTVTRQCPAIYKLLNAYYAHPECMFELQRLLEGRPVLKNPGPVGVDPNVN